MSKRKPMRNIQGELQSDNSSMISKKKMSSEAKQKMSSDVKKHLNGTSKTSYMQPKD